jgi:eukaryotic-like serine/threonine-protein kinase
MAVKPRTVQFTDDAFIPEDDAAGYYGLPQTPEAVASLLDDARTAIVRGHCRHAHALADIAFLSARRWTLGDREPLALSARHRRAEALGRLGRYGQALTEIDGTEKRPGILSLREQSPDFGPADPFSFAARYLRAKNLVSLGNHDQALAEIDGSDQRPGILRLREQSPDLGPTHPDTLTTRSLRGAVLSDLGRYEESERELRFVGAEQEEALGPNSTPAR